MSETPDTPATPDVPAELPAVPEAPAVPDAPAAALPDLPDIPDAPADENVFVRPLGVAATPDAGGFVWGTGRRKSSVARVRVRPADHPKAGGKASFTINGKEVSDYFSELQHQAACVAPLKATNTAENLEVIVQAHGGGITGQAEAILLGVARALKGYDPTTEQTLRDNNLLTRDARKVERKKYGQRGARRRFQFSKR